MLLRGIEWKSISILADKELESRKELTGENVDKNDILERDWF